MTYFYRLNNKSVKVDPTHRPIDRVTDDDIILEWLPCFKQRLGCERNVYFMCADLCGFVLRDVIIRIMEAYTR